MGQDGTERVDPEPVDDAQPEYQRAPGAVSDLVQPAAALEDRDIRARRQEDRVDGPGPYLSRHLALRAHSPGASSTVNGRPGSSKLTRTNSERMLAHIVVSMASPKTRTTSSNLTGILGSKKTP